MMKQMTHAIRYEISALPRPIRKQKIAQTVTLVLMGIVGALMVVEMSVHGILLGAFICMAAIMVGFPKQTQYILTNFNQVQSKYGFSPYLIGFLVLSIVCTVDFASAPADAQFLNNAQTWMTSAFGGSSNSQVATMITLIFNVLRALFVIYVGISLVRIVQAARNDEDWQSMARTPIIIVMAVFIADVITGLVTGQT